MSVPALPSGLLGKPLARPRSKQEHLIVVFAVSVAIFLLPTVLDAGLLLTTNHGGRRGVGSPLSLKTGMTPPSGARAAIELPVPEFDADEAGAHPGTAADPNVLHYNRTVGPVDDDGTKLGANWVSAGSSSSGTGAAVGAPASGNLLAAVDSAGAGEDEIDKMLAEFDLTPPVLPPTKDAENPDLDRDMGLGELLKLGGKSDATEGDEDGLGTDVEDGGGSAVREKQYKPAKSTALLPSTAGIRRDGLGFMFKDNAPPPLATRRISGYEWPASNITMFLDSLEPPPLGMDAQVWRDFRPWRGRGFSMKELLQTRARRTVLLNEQTEFSHEIFTTVVKDGVPYYLVSEMKQLAHYKVARLLKLLDFVLQLHSVGKRYTLPDVYLVWTVLPNPLLHARHARDLVAAPSGVAPLLSLCKTDHDLDVVYPNMYFRTLGWWKKVARGLSQAASSLPFSKRKAKMWWRGNSGLLWPASRPRVVTVSKWFSRPWADFAFTNMWTSVWRSWRRNTWKVHVPRNAAAIPFGSEKRMPIHSVARYKYALHLPGSFSGTYSRALQFLLWTGSVIFLYDCPFYEFYYHNMLPWKHFIPVNEDNLGDRMSWVNHHPEAVEEVAGAGKQFAKAFLTPDYIALYWKQLLDEYAALQRFTVELPDDACTCWRGDQKKPPVTLPRKTKRCPYLCDAIAFV